MSLLNFKKVHLTDTENILMIPYDYIDYYQGSNGIRIFGYDKTDQNVGEYLGKIRARYHYNCPLKTINILLSNPIFESDVRKEFIDYYKNINLDIEPYNKLDIRLDSRDVDVYNSLECVNIKTTNG